jgi:hypothetical protein
MGAYSISDGAEPVVTIAEVLFGKITLDGGRKEDHVVMRFAEKSVPGMDEVKPLVLNATNLKSLEKLYGKGADVLIGKRIKFYVDPAVKAIGGGTTEGVRIRPRIPQQATSGPPICSDCKHEITSATTKTGAEASAAQIVALSRKRYQDDLCADCMKKREAVDKAAEPPANTVTVDNTHDSAPETFNAALSALEGALTE